MPNTETPATPATGTRNGAALDGHAHTAETADIRRDLEQLKASVGVLTRHLQADGKAKAAEVKESLNVEISALLDRGGEHLQAVESKVKENPRGAVAAAFCAGMILNYVLRRR